jgi:hypothetical protein
MVIPTAVKASELILPTNILSTILKMALLNIPRIAGILSFHNNFDIFSVPRFNICPSL